MTDPEKVKVIQPPDSTALADVKASESPICPHCSCSGCRSADGCTCQQEEKAGE